MPPPITNKASLAEISSWTTAILLAKQVPTLKGLYERFNLSLALDDPARGVYSRAGAARLARDDYIYALMRLQQQQRQDLQLQPAQDAAAGKTFPAMARDGLDDPTSVLCDDVSLVAQQSEAEATSEDNVCVFLIKVALQQGSDTKDVAGATVPVQPGETATCTFLAPIEGTSPTCVCCSSSAKFSVPDTQYQVTITVGT